MKLREYAVVPRVRRVSTSCGEVPSRCGNRGCVRYHLPMHFPSPTRFALVALCALLCLASSCQSGAPGEGVQAERVILVSYDGVGGDLAWQWIVDGVASAPDGLATMAREGFSVRRLRMDDPTLTAVNHAVLATGRMPADTGVVSNSYRPPGGALGERVNGFDAVPEVPTLWSAARAQGLRVGSLLWPAGAGAKGRAAADFGLGWPMQPASSSAIIELDPTAAGTTGELPSADGVQTLAWPLVFDFGPGAEPESVEFLVALVDGNPDGKPRWDTVGVRNPSTGEWTLHGERDWFDATIELRLPDVLGMNSWASWSKIVHIDPLRGTVRLYRGAMWRTIAWPEDFENRLTAAIGPWPGAPDDRRLEEWWLDDAAGIDLDVYIEQIERLDRWIDAAAAWVAANEDFRLLLTYHPGPERVPAYSLIVDERQWAWSPGRALAASEGLKRVGRSVDRSLAALWSLLDPERDVLVAVSDHGQLPIHDEVRLNIALAGAGRVDIEAGDGRPWVTPSSPMVAVSSGAAAHIYLNLKDRDVGGVVERSAAGAFALACGQGPRRSRGRRAAGGGEGPRPGRVRRHRSRPPVER